MSCSVSKHFQADNNIGIGNQTVSSINATFELSSKDISLVSTKFELFKFSIGVENDFSFDGIVNF